MRKIVKYSLLFALVSFCRDLIVSAQEADAPNALWQATNNVPAKGLMPFSPLHYLTYSLDQSAIEARLAPLFADTPAATVSISLPMPDGTFRVFKIWKMDMLPPNLAARYPEIHTYSAEDASNPDVTAKIDVTMYGFHAMIFDRDNTSFIDPYDNLQDGYYMVHYMRDEIKSAADRMVCGTPNLPAHAPFQKAEKSTATIIPVSNGYELRTYRLALACDDQYAQAATGLLAPTVAEAFSKMVTTMARINGVYEREFSVHLNFVENEDALVFVSDTSDPYAADNDNPDNLLTDNQEVCDSIIGNANYDIGHVFSTGAGGLSELQVVCETGYKAESATGQPAPTGDGFDIDFVAHEMGHEFGADHPFNDNIDGNCYGNAVAEFAYEPGSGSTIMAYAGICDPGDLQPHSDPYFHSVSLTQIIQYISTGEGSTCPSVSSTGNKMVGYAHFTASYNIPYLTPFELEAPKLTDSAYDSVNTYCWEQWNLGDFGASLVNTFYSGPIFRSYNPDTSRTRIFPELSLVLNGTLSNAGIENAQGEKAPDVDRVLSFRCTFRNIYHNYGSITIPTDTIHIHAVNTGAGFTVTSPTDVTWAGGAAEAISWNVAGSDVFPIGCDSVNIFISSDGGYTWPYYLGRYPNSGSATTTMPNPPTAAGNCRVKVKGNNNVFFNVSDSFVLINNPLLPITPISSPDTLYSGSPVPVLFPLTVSPIAISIYPNPAPSALNIACSVPMQIRVTDVLGHIVWAGNCNGRSLIDVSKWSEGDYILQATNAAGNVTVKSFVAGQ